MINKILLQETIDKLAEKYKDKKIIVYGAGIVSSTMLDSSDISKLNIIGFSDIKYIYYREPLKGFKTFYPDEIPSLKPDLILIAAAEFKYIKKSWEKYFPELLKIPRDYLIPSKTLSEKLKDLKTNIFYVKKTIATKKNESDHSSVQITSKKVAESIFELEKEYNLLNLTFCDIKIWQILRFKLFTQICLKLNLMEQKTYSKPEKNFWNAAIFRLNLYKNAILYSPFRNKQKIDTLIFSTPTLKDENGFLRDVYIENLLKELNEKEISYEIINKTSPGITKINFSKNISDMESLKLFLEKYKIIKLKKIKKIRSGCTREFVEKVSHLENKIYEVFGVKLKLMDTFINESVDFKKKYLYFRKLFKKRGIKKIYVVCSYDKFEIIKAAKDLNIHVTELQHGCIKKHHLGYSYPYDKNPEFLPDRFYSFGEYWTELGIIPLEKENIVNHGYPYLIENKDKYRNIQKIENQILILSQWTIREQLLQLILDNINDLLDYKIIIKLHPSEEFLVNTNNETLLKLKEFSNVTISEKQKLHYLLASSSFVVGVYSTSIYEAIEFGCKPILVDLHGIEYMEDLIHKYNVPLLRKKIDKLPDILNYANKFNLEIPNIFRGS